MKNFDYDRYYRIHNGATDGSGELLKDYDAWQSWDYDPYECDKVEKITKQFLQKYDPIMDRDPREFVRDIQILQDYIRDLELEKEENLKYNNDIENKEENNSMFDTNNFMGKYFGKLAPGMCRMSMNGDMAIKTGNGYKTYDVKSGSLVNCDNFVFDIGSEFFFIIPTNKVETGDVILASGKPHCVIKVEKNRIEALRYEDSSVVTIVPEHHVFMGKTYFYGKIISMFGKIKGKGKGMNNIMKYMMMSEMMKGKTNGNGNGSMSDMLPMMMFMGNGNMFGDMFDNMFDFDEEDDTDESAEMEE